jgi:putative SOS response-associated peptidase YedK
MCSEYHVKTKINEIADELGVPIKTSLENTSWDQRIKFTLPAPVIAKKENEFRLGELIFPAQPFPNSRLSQIKEDDQIVRIYDIPLWKQSFKQFPCIVPMTSFLEPAYWGKNAGEVIEFTPPKESLFFVPGIVIKPRVPATGKLNGFSLLTHTASEQMLSYHHRLLVLLKPDAAVEYLNLGPDIDPEERFNFLIENRYLPEFKTAKSRHMAKGWEKRVDQHLAALEDENAYRSALQLEQVQG